MSKKKEHPKPPDPPKFEGKLDLYSWQKIGMPLIFLVPILALFGLFGKSLATESAASEALAVEVSYPVRFRFKQIASLDVTVRNLSAQTMPTVTVTIDQGYLDSFSTVSVSPDLKTITGENYVVELTDIPAGESRRVSVSVQAESYGLQEGTVAAIPPQGEPVAIELDTFVFP